MTAALLSLPCATAVISENMSKSGDSVVVERELEGGIREVLEMRLPVLLTIQSGINRPRYPSLSNILRAKGQRLESMASDALGVPPARQSTVGYSAPAKSRSATVLEGTPGEKAKQLIRILSERHLLVR
jgi:electron transfer flavoprotein beta subunit